MKLDYLLAPFIEKAVPQLDIKSLEEDSRAVKPGALFLAYPGFTTDGRQYMQKAIDLGAVAILYDSENLNEEVIPKTDLCLIAVPKLKSFLAAIARRFYEEPCRNKIVTGVTGTNGKTTIAYQLAQAQTLLEQPCAYIGTLGEGKPPHLNPLANTTPNPLLLQKLFYRYTQDNIRHISMEVSSHALAEQRIEGIAFQHAIFTNLTLDHLDFHKTMEDYAKAKALLFSQEGLESAIINHDDAYATLMQSQVKKSCAHYSYGVGEGALIRALSWTTTLNGTEIHISSPWGGALLKTQGLGFFNVYNALAIFTALMVQGYPLQRVVSVLPKLVPASGRMEVIAKRPYILVDYAHTPDALDNVLSTLATLKEGRLIVVFGCGGDRDKSKRPLMGAIASKKSDVMIITSDNPRTEDPETIVHEIESGIQGKALLYKILKREEAIAKALDLAKPEDLIVIAGKGHESYQQIGSIKHPFSDQEVVKKSSRLKLAF